MREGVGEEVGEGVGSGEWYQLPGVREASVGAICGCLSPHNFPGSGLLKKSCIIMLGNLHTTLSLR